MSHFARQVNQLNTGLLRRLEQGLRLLYQQRNHPYHLNVYNIGLFRQYCIERGLDGRDLGQQLQQQDAQCCVYLQFDSDCPVDPMELRAFFLRIRDNFINDALCRFFDRKLKKPSSKEMNDARSLLRQCCPDLFKSIDPEHPWRTRETQCTGIVTVFAMAKKYQIPLLTWCMNINHRSQINMQHVEGNKAEQQFCGLMRFMEQQSSQLAATFRHTARELSYKLSRVPLFTPSIQPRYQYDDDIECYFTYVEAIRAAIYNTVLWRGGDISGSETYPLPLLGVMCSLPFFLDVMVIPRMVIDNEVGNNGDADGYADGYGDDGDEEIDDDVDDYWKPIPEDQPESPDHIESSVNDKPINEPVDILYDVVTAFIAVQRRQLLLWIPDEIAGIIYNYVGSMIVDRKDIGDVSAKLNGREIKFSDDIIRTPEPLRARNALTRFLRDAIYRFSEESNGRERLVVIIDRRDTDNNRTSSHVGAKLYAFNAPTCNVHESESRKHEMYLRFHHFFESKRCILPGDRIQDGPFSDIGLYDSLEGQMFALSYHVYAGDDISCYWSRHGNAHRLRAEDMRMEWPRYFAQQPLRDELELRALDRLDSKDEQYELFEQTSLY